MDEETTEEERDMRCLSRVRPALAPCWGWKRVRVMTSLDSSAMLSSGPPPLPLLTPDK